MASFNDHLTQACRNLQFLQCINGDVSNCEDWQVTVCFYTALHLVNAHLAHYGMQYRTHNDVKNAINPEASLSITKIPEDEYAAYVSLQMLSRRSRYLVNEKDGNLSSNAPALTYSKHLAKAMRHLDRLIVFFNSTYKQTIPAIKIHCIDLRLTGDLTYLQVYRP